jgi:hypothetical protein
MVDPRYDNLPYWRVSPQVVPASAKHCRVDDSEIVASWYEAISAARAMLQTDEGAQVQESFYRHLMKSWGEHGLRFAEDYPWSNTNHSSFHEQAYILSALNRVLKDRPGDKQAERRAAGLVRGMRSLVIQRKVRTFWAGDFPETEPVYEFPNDVYLKEGGFDLSRYTGRGEQAIRNGIVLSPLVRRWEMAGDEVALDLARGIANHLLGLARYFNYRMEFFGHVHSAVWVASGLVRLGRLTGTERYVLKGKAIWDYVRSLSSPFGWVPEYTQYHPMAEEFCETCCIKDMIECATELIDAGYEECWDVVNRFARNQLVENQFKFGGFVAVDNRLPDTADETFHDLDQRIIGGFSGGAEPNSISLTRFRSIAGCCAGTAPQALQIVWDRAVTYKRGRLTVNLPLDKTTREAEVAMGYPNEGRIAVTTRRACDVAIRIHPWMGNDLTGMVDGRRRAFRREGNLAIFGDVPKGATVELRHPLRSKRVKEQARARTFTVVWRGPDVVDIFPRGGHLRLYQRVEGVKKFYPRRSKKLGPATVQVAAPTQPKQ